MKRIVIGLLLALLVVVPISQVNAQTEQQKALVVERCSLVKQYLDKQRRRDLVSRINRGHDYQALIDQQQALVSRLKNNGMDSAQFEKHLGELKSAFEGFRAAYSSYDDSLGDLIGVDCKKDPDNFFEALNNTRKLRNEVGQKTLQIGIILSIQRELIVDLKNHLSQIEQSVVRDI